MSGLIALVLITMPGIRALNSAERIPDVNPPYHLSQGTPDSVNVRLKSLWRESGSYTSAVDTMRNFLFLGSGLSVYIFDLSTPSNPSLVQTLNTEDYIRSIFYDYQTTRLYVLNEYDAVLDIWDVSSVLSPTLLNSFFVNGIYHAEAIYVRNDTAIIAEGYGLLRLYDVSNPASITFLDYVTLTNNPFSNDIDVSGHYAYVSTYYDGLQVVDLNNLATHSPIGMFNITETMYGSEISGNYAYAVTDSGLRVIDISTPTSPVQVSTLFNSDRWVNIKKRGNYLYIPTISSNPVVTNLRVIDVSNPLNPTEVGNYTINNDYYTGDMSVLGNNLYLPRTYGGLKVFDISNPLSPTYVTDYHLEPVVGTDIEVVGDYIFIPGYLNGLAYFNVSNPLSPVLLGYLGFGPGEFAYGVFHMGSILYLVTESKLYLIDISNPSQPQILSSLSFPGWQGLFDVYVSGNYAYVAAHDSGMAIVDISNPSNPVRVSSIQLPYGSGRRRVVVSGNYAYASYGGLHIIDVSNPTNPVLVSTYAPPNHGTSWDLAYYEYMGNRYVFVAFSDSLIVVDVTDPANPTHAGGWSTNYSTVIGVKIFGNKAIVANYGWGVRILDIISPSNLSEVGYYDWPNHLWETGIIRNKYIVAVNSSTAGFAIFEPYDGATFVDESESISPRSSTRVVYTKQGVEFIPSHIGILRILDVSGRTLITQSVENPQLIKNLKPGVYFWKLTSNMGKSMESGKFIQLTR